MRLWLAVLGIALVATSSAQYARQGVRMMARMALSTLPGQPTSGAGCVGYVSASGQEYACMGVRNGTIVVRITNPDSPVLVAHIPGLVSTWHEMAILGNYLYSVADSVNQGMQIIDLSRVDENIVELKSTYTANGLARVHTIQANPATKTLYLNGSNLGLVILDANDPENPVELARWSTKYVHDSQIVSYSSGPYAGKEIAFLCCGGSGLYIVDITDRGNLITLGTVPYLTGSYYTHSGQLTPDRKYFLINDEFDEKNSLMGDATTHIVKVEDLNAPSYVGPFTNPINAIDHNSQLLGSKLYLAAYRSGLRVYDVSNPLGIVEKGFFDTYPSGGGFSYDGAWGTFVFPSGNAIISDINRGLFVVDPTEAAGLGAPLLSSTAVIGQVIDGGIKELRTQDRSMLRMQWRRGMSGTTAPTFQIVVEGQSSYSPAVTLDLSLGGLPSRNGTLAMQAELFNWGTGAYEPAGGFNVSKGNPQATFAGLAATKFVSSTGLMRARITATSLESDPPAKDVFLFNMVRFVVQRS